MTAPVHAETKNGTATSSTSVVSASLGAGSSDSLYLARIANRQNSNTVSSVTGLGLSWTLVRAQCAGRGQTRVEVWQATGAGSSGAVTANFSGTPAASVIVVSRFTGVDTTDPTPTSVGYNTNGSSGACSGGTDNGNLTGSITTAYADSLVDVAANSRTDTSYSDTAGWTTPSGGGDISAGTGGDVTTLSAEYKTVASPGATTVGGSGNVSSVDWCFVAVEIRAAASTQTATPAAAHMVLNAPAATLAAGSVTLTPSAASATLVVLDAALSPGSVALTPSAAHLVLNAPDAALSPGSVVVTPSAAHLVLVAPSAALFEPATVPPCLFTEVGETILLCAVGDLVMVSEVDTVGYFDTLLEVWAGDGVGTEVAEEWLLSSVDETLLFDVVDETLLFSSVEECF